ncbi:MAG: DUF898 family protein [Pseudomonadota bacterium]
MSEQTDTTPFWHLDRYKTDQPATADGTYGPPKRPVHLTFEGDTLALLLRALRDIVLTVLTLGFYRFWMITRLRRFYWAAIHIDGDPLEYTGRPLEKLLGFLVALVVLALYLGLVNLGLVFAGLSLATDDPIMVQLVLQISIISTLPLIFYARYRAWQYQLARTRWRGIRFGLEPGAWGYTARALGLSLLTLVTFGLAYPYQQFVLARYIVNRASFGDLRFAQGGSWTELLWHWLYVYLILGLLGVCAWGLIANPGDPMAAFLGVVAISIASTAASLLWYRYGVHAFRILWSERRLGETGFENDVGVGRIIAISVGGYIAVGAITIAFVVLFGMFFAIGLGRAVDPEAMRAVLETADVQTILAVWPLLAGTAAVYLGAVAVAFALSQALIYRPILAAKVRAMQIEDVGALAASRQRAREDADEAGGFADALGLDVGAGI